MAAEVALVNMKVKQGGKIAEITGGREMVRRLEALGIRPGKRIRKVSSVFDRGPVIVDLDGRMIAVGRGQASRIFVITDLGRVYG
jgi:ferrous iron transport protein A